MPSAAPALSVEWNFRTENLEAYRARVAGLLKPFALEGRPRGYYDAKLAHHCLFRAQMMVIDYGEQVLVDAQTMKDFYLLQVPLRGAYQIRQRGTPIVSQGQAHLIHEATPLSMECAADLSLLVFKFDRRFFTPLAGRRAAEPYGDILAFDQPSGQAMRRTIEFVAGEALGAHEAPGLLRGRPEASRHAEELLLSAILAAFHPAGSPQERIARAAANPAIRRAEAFILDNLRSDFTLDDIVGASRVSLRSLFYGFRRAHGVGPWAWARAQRLEGAREALLAADPASARVTDIALDWGFTHLGRFSAAYRAQFGEAPSQTLQAVRLRPPEP